VTLTCDLTGDVALVTGATSGLGRRFAAALAGAGAAVAITGRRTELLDTLKDEIEAAGGWACAIKLDITDLDSIKNAVETTERELGPVGILVNNAGAYSEKMARSFTEAEFDTIVNTNIKGSFFMAQEVGNRMIARKEGGSIINLSSMTALRPVQGMSVYGMTKAAEIQMTKSLALEWARYDINVNAICPGFIDSEMTGAYFRTEPGKAHIDTLPRKRIGQPEMLDGLLLTLASRQSSAFMTGSIIRADDGQML
jgi:NAD(P)-dependent dehydrogenase (short-subunit alcohol dehydrogenase family)